ncbi:MAG: hypothetical protein GC149_18750 [Gammaproteobacteria bacterium]|nr:hypothetical protein [Gammaproteobacteria bacterium]
MNKLILLSACLLITSCAHRVSTHTLRDIDVPGNKEHSNFANTKPSKNQAEIRDAYTHYLEHASKNDISRNQALQRLAQLEFELTSKLDSKASDTNNPDANSDYIRGLDSSIQLLKLSLRDYPNAKGADKTLYQLAKAYDQKGDIEQPILTLETMTEKYPRSQYYVESVFRLAEYAFTNKDYSKAEDLYTDVIVAKKNSEYLENALYKRGWARFKQEYYQDAIDDFHDVINLHKFSDYDRLDSSQKSQFEEYFRGFGLSFIYLGGEKQLNTYFGQHKRFKFIYQTYQEVSQLYIEDQRYSDAADTLESYIKLFPESSYAPVASIGILDVWRQGGFTNKLLPALDTTYAKYHPNSHHWENYRSLNKATYDNVTSSIKKYVILAAAYYHKDFQSRHQEASFENAKNWYERYLKYYNEYSRKDHIHYLYAELLLAHHDLENSLHQYETAAYDSGIILDKDAAYSSIIVSYQLYSSAKNESESTLYLDKLARYTRQYAELYPGDKNTPKLLAQASQAAYKSNAFEQAVNLTELQTGDKYDTTTYTVETIKANSYFKLKQFQDAESAYISLLHNYKLSEISKQEISNNLALSIYNQARSAESAGRINDAMREYDRISDITPGTPIAETGMYDGIALCMQNNLWDDAIAKIKKFQALYPASKHNNDVSKKLSVAYLKSHQDIAAAKELVKIANADSDMSYRTAAFWKSGELFESKRDYKSAISSYREYVKHTNRPYPQYLEAMNKIANLYASLDDTRNSRDWLRKIVDTDKKASDSLKTDRTNQLAAYATLQLAKVEDANFGKIRLVIPLKRSLSDKKYYMQRAVNLYGRASSYGIQDITTESTYAIAEIYRQFSQALLNSERPRNLSKNELEQYNILLEDQSYPFEDKAIEFYSINLAHTKENIFNTWMQQSYARLKELYPARYNRDVKLESYINVLH